MDRRKFAKNLLLTGAGGMLLPKSPLFALAAEQAYTIPLAPIKGHVRHGLLEQSAIKTETVANWVTKFSRDVFYGNGVSSNPANDLYQIQFGVDENETTTLLVKGNVVYMPGKSRQQQKLTTNKLCLLEKNKDYRLYAARTTGNCEVKIPGRGQKFLSVSSGGAVIARNTVDVDTGLLCHSADLQANLQPGTLLIVVVKS